MAQINVAILGAGRIAQSMAVAIGVAAIDGVAIDGVAIDVAAWHAVAVAVA